VAGDGASSPAALSAGGGAEEIEEVLPAQPATWDPALRTPRPAQLLLLFPTTEGLTLGEMD